MRATSIGFVLLVAACATKPRAMVPFNANASAMSRLGGKWTGEYSSPATGRSGSIVFSLDGDERAARGEVVMYSTIVSVPADPAAIAAAHNSHAADVLTISFVRAADDVVTGRLDPYPDPKTGAIMSTTFTGRMAGDTIEGTFESLSSDSNTPQRGRWRVKRQGS